MLVLLNYDALNNPLPNSSTNRNKDYASYLGSHPYDEFTNEELATVIK